MTRVEIEIDARNKGRIKQAEWARWWQKCAKFCCPEKERAAINLAQTVVPGYRPDPQRQNDVAVDGLRVFTGGIKTYVCPGPSSGWWMWEPNSALPPSKRLKDWLADCVQRADMAMDAGGFYSGSQMVFQDLGWAGVAGMFADSTGELPISFKALNPTEFVHEVDFAGKLSAMRVTYWKSAGALIEEFGRSNVPPAVRQDVESNRPETMHEVIHSVYKRPAGELKGENYAGNPERMPFASCWIHVGAKSFLREGGYEEMPFTVPRWRTQSGSDNLFGIAPAMDALASARGVNLMDMLAATQVEVALNPRILAPPGSGPIDLGPGGITPSLPGLEPKEWLSDGGRNGLQASDTFIARKEAQILRAFHADLFEKLAPIAQKREMTNGLVDALERESLNRISPAIGQITQDYIDPIMKRIFMVNYRAGVFAPPPEEAFYQDASGARYLVFPRAVQTSRMAQALNSRKVWAFRNMIERIAPLLPLKPELLDPYRWDVMEPDLSRSDGMPSEWMLSEDELAQLRQARAQAQQQAQAQQLVADMATKQPEALAAAAGLNQEAA